MNKSAAREEIETFAKEEQINIILASETQINKNPKEIRETYTWYFSGENRIKEDGKFVTGVGILIKSTLNNYIKEVIPVNDRIITITLNYTLPITFIGVYAPPSERTKKEKEAFYKALTKRTAKKHKAKGPTYILGDFNASIQKHLSINEYGIGNHTFNPTNITLETLQMQFWITESSFLIFV